MAEITPDLLRQLLTYEPDTGRLFWKERPPEMFKDARYAKRWNVRYAGHQAFMASHSNGYRTGQVFRVSLYAHRVAWAIHHGKWPERHVDHINGDPADNRIANLRDVPRESNMRNQRRHARNISGVTGVSWDRRRKRWVAMIWFHGKARSLGHFDKREDAIAARKAAERDHDYHPNHGRTANGKL
jgi:hypothetical protein